MAKPSSNIIDNFIEFILYPDAGYQNRPLRLLLDTTKIIGIQDAFSTLQSGGNKKGTTIHTIISSFIVQDSYEEVVSKLNISSSVITQA